MPQMKSLRIGTYAQFTIKILFLIPEEEKSYSDIKKIPFHVLDIDALNTAPRYAIIFPLYAILYVHV